MSYWAMRRASHSSWQPVADIEGYSLIEQHHFRLVLNRSCTTFHVRLLQQKGPNNAKRICWMPVAELTGDNARKLLARGRAIAYAQLAEEGDYIDWDDQISPDIYPTAYCYICEAHGIDCVEAEDA